MRSTAAHSTLNLDEVNPLIYFLINLIIQEKQMYGQKNMKKIIIYGLTQHILDTKIYLE